VGGRDPEKSVEDGLAPDGHAPSRDELMAFVSRHGNDLEAPAIALHPAIPQALAALRALPGCLLARMSGSGASCFGLFDSSRAVAAAARALRVEHPQWWIRPTVLGDRRA
jgi:4-diphosphocytidyl-2-C-methyl-D-erythritol kinase